MTTALSTQKRVRARTESSDPRWGSITWTRNRALLSHIQTSADHEGQWRERMVRHDPRGAHCPDEGRSAGRIARFYDELAGFRCVALHINGLKHKWGENARVWSSDEVDSRDR